MILAKSIEDSGFRDQIGAGVVLTGGMTKLEGIRELSSAIFDNMPVRIAKPKEMQGLFETLRDPCYSTAIGLILYGGGNFTPYEIDSNKKLRYKSETIEPAKNIQNILEVEQEESATTKEALANIAEMDEKEGFKAKIGKFWNMITQLF
jgi:cell division protein FtsA